MGPFGNALGMVLNWTFGFTGYLVVIAFIIVAIRIFAVGLELKRELGTPHTLWRERFGIVLALLCSSAILHLAVRPYRVAGSSAGGMVGEVTGEVLCSLASTAGAWILGLTGLALSLLLATNISWARAGHSIYLFCRWATGELRTRCRQNMLRVREGMNTFAQLLKRQELPAEAGGAAALPPIVRLDLSDAPAELVGNEKKASPKKQGPIHHEKTAFELGLPHDLEIGADEDIPPEICITEGPSPAGEAITPPRVTTPQRKSATRGAVPAVKSAEAVEEQEQLLAQAAAPEPATKMRVPNKEAEVAALTIVESDFQASEQILAKEEGHAEGKRVEQTDSPGFILNEETYRPPPLSLLEYKENDGPVIDRDAIFRQADLLVKTLADYKIQGRVTEVHPGPVVTMYEFVPAPGTRICKIAKPDQ